MGCIHYVTFQLLISFPQMRQPGKLVGVDEIVSGLERLGESPEVTNPLRQYLRPALATLPMYVYRLGRAKANNFIHPTFVILFHLSGRSCKSWWLLVTWMATEDSAGRSLKALATLSLSPIGLGKLIREDAYIQTEFGK